MPDKDNFSCIPKEPLIKLDEKGQAPIVKYTMPHETSYNAKSYTPLDVDRKCFKAEHRKESNVNDYERFEGKSIEEITKILHFEFSNFKASRPIKSTIEKAVISKGLQEITDEIELKPSTVKIQNQ